MKQRNKLNTEKGKYNKGEDFETEKREIRDCLPKGREKNEEEKD